MWTTIYNIRFRDDDNGQWLVEVQSPDASATAPVDLVPAGEPLEWRSNGDESQTQTIVSGAGTLRIHVTEETAQEIAVGRLLPTKALDRRVKVTREGLTVWVGYIQMQTLSQDWDAALYDIELPLMDTIAALDVIYIDNTETATTTMTLFRHAWQKAMGDIGDGETPGDWMLTNWPHYSGRASGAKWWADAAVFSGFFVSEDDKDRRTYADALDIILSPWGKLTQLGSRWVVVMPKTNTFRLYKPDPNNDGQWVIYDADSAYGYIYVADIGASIASTNNNASILPPPSKVTLNYEPEEGAVNYSNDTVCEFNAKNIKSNASAGGTGLQWTDGEGDEKKTHKLFYLNIGEGNNDNNLDWPVKVLDRSRFHATWHVNSNQDYDHGPVSERTLSFHDGANIYGNCTWRQVLEENEGWKTSEAQTYIMDCNIVRTWNEFSDVPYNGYNTWYDMWGDITTWRILREVITSEGFVLSLKFEMKINRLTEDATFAAQNENTKVWQPLVQLYWSATKNGTPTRVYNRTTGGWDPCNGFFYPNDGLDASIVRYSDIKAGKKFHVYNGQGYISLRIYASGWPADGADMAWEAAGWYHVNNPGTWFTMTGFSLGYEAWVGTDPTTLLEWNTDREDKREIEYTGGTEEINATFKTLAGGEPTPSAFLTPRRGFNDSNAAVTKPREMLEIDEAQWQRFKYNGTGIPGVTAFALFGYDMPGEGQRKYFPAAVGMKARENTVSLKLIRTLQS